jgi:hypothetical protein
MADSDKAGLRQMVPSLFNGIATAIAAVAGLIGVLHQTGYLGNHPRLRDGIEARSRAQMRMPDETQLAAVDSPAAAALPAAGAPERETAPALHHARNLTGAWRDKGANCHLIKQAGHELTVTTYFADNGHPSAVGTGTVKGRFVSMRINSANPESLQAELNLSDDGRELSGMVKGVKGAHAAMWRFIGPSCSEVASRPASSN